MLSTTDRQASDLPQIGRPATRALAQIGCVRLDQVATMSERDLLALHGVGPKAVRILREALAERGMAFAPGAPTARSVTPAEKNDDLESPRCPEQTVRGDPQRSGRRAMNPYPHADSTIP